MQVAVPVKTAPLEPGLEHPSASYVEEAASTSSTFDEDQNSRDRSHSQSSAKLGPASSQPIPVPNRSSDGESSCLSQIRGPCSPFAIDLLPSIRGSLSVESWHGPVGVYLKMAITLQGTAPVSLRRQ